MDFLRAFSSGHNLIILNLTWQRWVECGGIHLSHRCSLVPCQHLRSALGTLYSCGWLGNFGMRCCSVHIQTMIQAYFCWPASWYLALGCLAFKSCKKKVISRSHNIVSWLDISHHSKFSSLLKHKLGCDMQVVYLIARLEKTAAASLKSNCRRSIRGKFSSSLITD